MFEIIEKRKLPDVIVMYEGAEWCLIGEYSPAERDVGIDSPSYRAEAIWKLTDTDETDISDLLKPIVISGLEDLAVDIIFERMNDELPR